MTQSPKLSMPDRFKLQEFLKEVLEIKEAGLVRYKSGHNDFTVAEKFGFSKSAVAGTRTRTFGKLQHQSSPRGTEEKNRLEGINKKIVMLEAQLTKAEEKIQKINRRVLDLEVAATEPANEQTTFSVMRQGA